MKVCAVTITGGRPDLFRLCRRWVARMQPDCWVIGIDDDHDNSGYDWHNIGNCASEVTERYRISLPPDEDYLTPTVRVHKLLAATLEEVPKDHHVVIIEDDDWYPRNYIDTAVMRLEDGGYELTSSRENWHYQMPLQRWLKYRHAAPVAAAGATAINSVALERYIDIVGSDRHASDHEAWKVLDGDLGMDTHRVSLKGAGYGMPGARGATTKHNPDTLKLRGWNQDTNYLQLRAWLGDDAEEYIKLCQPSTR